MEEVTAGKPDAAPSEGSVTEGMGSTDRNYTGPNPATNVSAKGHDANEVKTPRLPAAHEIFSPVMFSRRYNRRQHPVPSKHYQ